MRGQVKLELMSIKRQFVVYLDKVLLNKRLDDIYEERGRIEPVCLDKIRGWGDLWHYN